MLEGLKKFFRSEINNEDRGNSEAHNGSHPAGDTPATLRSCLDSLRQYPDDLLMDEFGLDGEAADIEIERLIGKHGEVHEVKNFLEGD